MPKYHALDTAVKLYVWDPQQPINTSNTLSNDGQALISNGQQRDVSSVPFSIFDGVPAPTKSPPADPAFGYDVDVVSEEYFEGQEGVDFLCHDMPFFLVNAGKELFEPPQLSFGHSGSISQENDALMLDQHCGNSTLSSFVSTSLENAIEAPADGAHDVDAESNLSDISSSLFTPRIESSPGPEARGTIVDDEPSAKPQSKRELHLEEYEARKKGPRQFISKPITGPKPIKISVDLSKKSFAPSLFNNQAQEVCINIFYNGELTHSRVVRAAMKEDDKHLIFSGRRVEALLEVPWVVRPNWQSSDGYSKVTTSGFEDRWNRVNQLLFGEADEWRRYGKHRSPMGEYLEELSKKAIPESVKNLERGAGNKMGIIDVVIALGRTFSVSKVGRLLREPRRKLHEDIYGKEKLLFMVPEELRPLRKAQIIADYNGEISQSVGSPGNSDASTVEERSIVGATPKAISINNSRNLANEKYQAQDDLAKHAHDAETPKTPEPQRAEDVLSVQLQCSESIQISTSVDRVDKYVNADVMTTVRSEPSPCQLLEKNSTDLMPPPKSHRASLPSMMTSSAPDLSQEIDGARAATILITSARERPPHPNTPKAIPQKRYKGSDSYPPPKRRKVDEHWEVLPFDSEKSTSLSTRSRRAASSTVGITPEHVRGQQLIKGIQRSHKPKNNPEISGSRELPPSSTPLSDLQTESSPYIPENSSASPTKRRASNSKLADRPQNRRRGPRAVAHGMPVAAKGVSANIPPPVFGCLSTSDTVDLPGVSGIVQYTPKGPTEERHNQREPPGTTNFVRGRGMDFGFDGTGGERKPRHRSRGSDGSIQAESSPSTSKKSVSENSDKSNDKLLPQTEDVKMTSASQPAASKKITRIVLVSKNKNGPSITKKINMRPFGASNNETRIDRSQAKATTPTSKKASKTQTSNWVSPNKFVTINHPSQKKRKLELEAQARNANAGPIPKAAESKSCPSPSPETSTSRKPSKSKSTVESTISGVDTLVMNAKSAPNSGFMISTTSTRSRSNETQSKNTALPKSSNVTVQSRPGAMEKVFSKPTRTRNATGVGARELQSLLEPHKPSMGVDSSFGDSFTQPRGAARPSRNPSDKLQIPQTQIQSDTGVTDQGDPKLTLVDPISLEATVEGSILTVKRRMSNVKEFKTSPQEQATPTKASPDSTLHAPTSTKEIGNNSERSPLMTRPSDTVAIQSIATSRRQSRSYSQNPQNMKKPSPGSSLAANEVIEQQIVEQEPTGVLQAGSIGRPLNTTLLEEIRLSSTPSRRRSSVGTNPLIIPTPTAMPVGKGPITDLKAEAKKEVVETPSPVAASDSLVPPSPTWKPNELSQDSVLTYAGGEAWPGLSVYPSSGNVCRSIRAEREGVFRASGVLMGVRFVIGL